MPNSRRRWLFLGLCGAVVALGAIWYWRQLGRECTDDAQLDGDVIAIPSRITAVVKRIAFKDNQRVHAGELLVELDDEQLKARLAQAEASYEAAVAAAHAAEEEEASLAEVSAHGDVVAFVNQARARTKAAQSQVAVAKANLELAKIELSYTQIVAPVAGTISKRSAAAGQILGAGQPIAHLVPADAIWVTANFKETQLRSIRVAQPVDISLDANPSQPLNGVVESFSAAAGVRFALLPPDNATGNFTKVVQRVPVRIKLTRVPKDQLLLPGLNVEVVVRTR